MVKEIENKDLKQALDLVNDVFSEFVATEYSAQGKHTFESYLNNKYDEIFSDLQTGHKKMWVYCQNNKILGVISIRDASHISLMFVDKNHHRKGIARQMFQAVLDNLADNPDITQITVNSSPYAVEVYERLGFTQTDARQEKDGIIFIPMARNINEKE